MTKVKNRVLGIFLICTLFISTIAIFHYNVGIAYATSYPAESQVQIDAYIKLKHLEKSLRTNYLGIKNQPIWETYIKQIKDLIKTFPSSEKKDGSTLTLYVNKVEALVNAIARINHVEKSMQPKEKGGYGNALIPKNVPQWEKYIELANLDLEKIDKSQFLAQYEDLIKRRDIVNDNLAKIMETNKL